MNQLHFLQETRTYVSLMDTSRRLVPCHRSLGAAQNFLAGVEPPFFKLRLYLSNPSAIHITRAGEVIPEWFKLHDKR